MTIKKTIGAIILTVVLSVGLISCGDDNGPDGVFVLQPTRQFLEELQLTGTFVNDSDHIFGTLYRSLKDGHITKLCVLAPADGNYSLQLWDLTDTTVIASVINPADSGIWNCIDITPVVVGQASRVAVTVRTSDYYTFDGGGGPMYPHRIEGINIIGYGSFILPPGHVFPNQFFNDHMSGVVDLVYETDSGVF